MTPGCEKSNHPALRLMLNVDAFVWENYCVEILIVFLEILIGQYRDFDFDFLALSAVGILIFK